MEQTNKRLIFVSCGQVTEEEKQLGTAVKGLIDDTEGFQAYFAEKVHDLTALGHHIFDALHRCSGAISFLQKRGSVTGALGEDWGIRSSVWVNQEIAILAFRNFLEFANLPILVFKDTDVRIEGAMTSVIVNPLPLLSIPDTLAQVKAWLESTDFAPCLSDEFEVKWNKLSLNSKRALNCLASEGGEQVKELNIRRKLQEKYGLEKNTASDAVRKAKQQFSDTGLVICHPNIHTGHEMSFHPTWRWYLARVAQSVK
jgi:hypothetical protein